MNSETFQPHDDDRELLPLVDEQGRVTGRAPRGRCHDGSRLLHPVVHLHVFDPAGRLFLQKRPLWKAIQPGRWDTAVGGHMAAGETVADALRRETAEELGLDATGAEPLTRYVFESDVERELVYVYRLVTTAVPRPSAELDGGRFFSAEEIEARLGTGFFTPNFESEYRRVFLSRG